jgi:hypothetical protein
VSAGLHGSRAVMALKELELSTADIGRVFKAALDVELLI